MEIAQITAARPATVTAPSGWTLIRSDVTGSSSGDLRQSIYYHLAGSSEPLRYTWGLSTAAEANGALSAWAGVDGSAPVATSSGRTDATGHDTYANTVAVDQSLGYWRLGETSGSTAFDSSGNGFNGTYSNVTRGQTGAIAGDTDNAAAFNGSSSYVSLGQPAAFQQSQFSIEGWFKTTSTAAGLPKIYRRTSYGNMLGLDAGRPYVRYFDAAANQLTARSPSSYADGAWHHAVGTFDGTTLKIYVDGVLVSSTPTTAPVYYGSGSGGAAIGRDGASSNGYFNGTLDDVALYPVPMKPSRVAAHYLAGRSAPASPAWVAPSVPYTNGELNLALYGGRPTGPSSALSVPASYNAVYDTQTNGITVGLDSKAMGPIAGATGDQSVTGPPSRWVAQQVLLRPQYDSSLRQTTPDGPATYDKLNRLVGLNGHAYTYDGTGNRLTQTKSTQAVTHTSNDANQLASSTTVITRIGTATGAGTATPTSPSFSLAVPAGTQAGDQLLVAVTATQADSVTVAGYTTIATASGATPASAKTVVLRRTATGTGADTPTITLSTGASAAAVLTAYRGVHPTNPIDNQQTAAADATRTLTNPGVPSSTWGAQLVVFQGAAGNTPPGTWTPPPGATQQTQKTDQTARSAGVADMALGSATGTTGPLTSTLATTADLPANLAGVALTLRPATRTYSYDQNGNLTGTNDGGALAYDTADRTTSLTSPGGNPTTFTYRGAGQSERATMSPATRVGAGCTLISGCPPTTATLGTSATFEHTALGVSAETIGADTTYYVRDPRGGLLAQRTPTGTSYYRFDGQGSITGLLNSSGSIVATYGYDPYGQLTSLTSTGNVGINNPWRYAGAYQDGTGLYKMGHRYYDPTTGRFTQQDPIHDPFDPKSWNRYVYVGGDPINYTDPTGLSWWNPASWDWCGDGWGARSAEALSLLPPFGAGGTQRAWAGSAGGWALFSLGNLVGQAAAGNLGIPALSGVGGTIIRGGSKLSTGVTLLATAYDLERRLFCD